MSWGPMRAADVSLSVFPGETSGSEQLLDGAGSVQEERHHRELRDGQSD
ncbi:hypothetical protein scyTo_0027853, partial [Scyliorhinus torazame]|nr:hypothetical protein [Scyliorhinus torazame]